MSSFGFEDGKEGNALVNTLFMIIFQDEMLARFVVNSHVKHHPNNQTEQEDEDMQVMNEQTNPQTCEQTTKART